MNIAPCRYGDLVERFQLRVVQRCRTVRPQPLDVTCLDVGPLDMLDEYRFRVRSTNYSEVIVVPRLWLERWDSYRSMLDARILLALCQLVARENAHRHA